MVQRPHRVVPERARGTEHSAPRTRRLGGGGPSLQAPRRHLLPARGRPCAPHSLCSVAQPARALCALRPRAAARPHSPAASSNSSGGGSRAARTGRAMVQRRRPQPQRRGARAGVGGAQSEGGGARAPRWPAYPSLTRPAAQSMQWTTRGRGPAVESGFAPAPPASCTSPPGGTSREPGPAPFVQQIGQLQQRRERPGSAESCWGM